MAIGTNFIGRCFTTCTISGAHSGFQIRGGVDLKKLRRAEGGAKIFGVFCVKNHDFTPKSHICSNCGGRREKFWGISCEKSRFYTKKSYFFQFWGGARRDPPLHFYDYSHDCLTTTIRCKFNDMYNKITVNNVPQQIKIHCTSLAAA